MIAAPGFGNADSQADFRRALEGYDSFHGPHSPGSLPRNPDAVLNILDNYLRLRIADGKKIALVIDFAETIARPVIFPACPLKIAIRWSSSSAGAQP